MTHMVAPLGRCVLCRAPVYGQLDGVLFGARGRGLFVACHAHAPMVKSALYGGATFAKRALVTFAEKRFPILSRVVREALEARAMGSP